MTTIKVDSEVRDRLAVLARESGCTLGQQVAALVERAERSHFLWPEFEEDYQRLHADTEEWARYLTQALYGDATGRHSATEEKQDDLPVYRGLYPMFLSEPLPRRDIPTMRPPAA